VGVGKHDPQDAPKLRTLNERVYACEAIFEEPRISVVLFLAPFSFWFHWPPKRDVPALSGMPVFRPHKPSAAPQPGRIDKMRGERWRHFGWRCPGVRPLARAGGFPHPFERPYRGRFSPSGQSPRLRKAPALSTRFRLKSLWCLPLASIMGVSLAQTAFGQNISVISGNGQLIASPCYIDMVLARNFVTFEPMVVQVTDNLGNPVSNVPVTWTLTSGLGVLSSSVSTTDSAGHTSSAFTSTAVPSTMYFQSEITAGTASGGAVVFYLSQAALTNATNCSFSVQTAIASPPSGITITGSAGGTGSPSIAASVTTGGLGVPNVSVRLINAQNTPGASLAPAATCATGAGADPGAVLTDVNGNATCTPILQGVAGTGTVLVLYGGVAVASSANGSELQGGPLGYSLSTEETPENTRPVSYTVQVTSPKPSAITIIGGNNQSASPGQGLPAALTAKVVDQNGNGLAGEQVLWAITPSTAATISPTVSTADVNGNITSQVTLGVSISGQFQVTAALASNPSIAASFTESSTVAANTLQTVSGNNQQALENQPFAEPLVVQVNGSNGAPLPNATVRFSISGPGTLSATTAATASNGQAQVSVTAGATAGTVAVIVNSGDLSLQLTLTVLAAPSLTPADFLNGAGFYPTDSSHSALTPCGITEVVAPGLASQIQGVGAATESFGIVPYLPYTLAGMTITVAGSQAPIYSVANINRQLQVEFQVPCSVVPGNDVPVTVTVNGGSTTVNVIVRSAGPGIFQTTEADGSIQAIILRPDGSLMDSETNPVRPGEQVAMFVTGIGPTSPPVATNSLPPPGISPNATGQVIVGLDNAGVPVISSRLTPDLVGVAEVTFQVPASTSTGTHLLSMGVNAPDGTPTQFSQTSMITVHQ
jgi:uncharacterized protein (TIGR03437 family)